MDMKMKEKAKQHVDALKGMAEAAGMSVEDLVEEVLGEEAAEEGEMEEGVMEDEESSAPSVDKAKIALIVGKLKKAKGE